MDPIHPIAPGPPPLGRAQRLPVERVERVSRERDRPAPEERRRRRREPPPAPPRMPGEDDGDQPHVDVRV
ncbi:MAG TPA: hypothetical protein VN772_00635 [Solirubrobacteraceae bacterium]|nr:hypothetical protein [Solirubrobacteraceae bacterium]